MYVATVRGLWCCATKIYEVPQQPGRQSILGLLDLQTWSSNGALIFAAELQEPGTPCAFYNAHYVFLADTEPPKRSANGTIKCFFSIVRAGPFVVDQMAGEILCKPSYRCSNYIRVAYAGCAKQGAAKAARRLVLMLLQSPAHYLARVSGNNMFCVEQQG